MDVIRYHEVKNIWYEITDIYYLHLTEIFRNILDIQHDAKIHNYQKQHRKSDILEELIKFNVTHIVL
jgi:hypothetical protein